MLTKFLIPYNDMMLKISILFEQIIPAVAKIPLHKLADIDEVEVESPVCHLAARGV